MTINSKIDLCGQVLYTQLSEDEGVLLHMDTKRYYTLNETGSVIWNYLNKGLGLAEIVNKLEDEYEVETPKAEESVLRLVEELLKEKLIITRGK